MDGYLISQLIESSASRSSNSSIVGGIGLFILFIFLLGALIIILFIVAFVRSKKESAFEKKSLDMRLLEIRLPQTNEVEINAMEQLFASLYGLSSQKGMMSASDFKRSDFISA